MRLARQIFQKDWERLWPAVAGVQLIHAIFVFRTATHVFGSAILGGGTDPAPDIAVPLAWALLIGLFITQDPFAGDNPLWVTLPMKRRAIAMAKLAEVVLFVNAPYFLACALILALRGFNPFLHIPHLLWKQLVALTFIAPVAAIAVIVRKLPHLLIVLLAASGATVMFRSRLPGLYSAVADSWDIRFPASLIFLTITALAVVLFQVARGRTLASRIALVVSAIFAGWIYIGISPDQAAAASAALSADETKDLPIALRLAGDNTGHTYRSFDPSATSVAMEFETIGVPRDVEIRLRPLHFDVDVSGKTFNGGAFYSNLDVRPERYGSYIALRIFKHEIRDALLAGPATVRGIVVAELYRKSSTDLNTIGRTTIDESTRCTSSTTEETTYQKEKYSSLDVLCDAAEKSTGELGLTIPQRPMRPVAMQVDGPRILPVAYPRALWVAPLQFMNGVLAVMPGETPQIVSYTPLGSKVLTYTFANLDIKKYVVKMPARSGAAQ